MAKIRGIQGNVTGKIANTIYAVVKGVNIARAYNPEPANPQTSGQVESRAKLKTLSQLAAALAPVIGYEPKGLVSARNIFIKENYEKVLWQNEVAEVPLTQVDLTGSRVGLGTLSVVHDANGVSSMVSNAAEGLVSVVFGTTIIKPNGAIIVRPVQIVTTPNSQGNWPTSPEPVEPGDHGIVYAWGIRANDVSQLAKYGYLMAQQDNVATLMANIREQYAGGKTNTETLTATFSATE